MKILVLGCSHLGATLASTLARSNGSSDPILFIEIEKEQPSFEEVMFHELAEDTLELIPFMQPIVVEEYVEYFAPIVSRYSPQQILKRISCTISKSLHLIIRSRPPPEHHTIVKKLKPVAYAAGSFLCNF